MKESLGMALCFMMIFVAIPRPLGEGVSVVELCETYTDG